MKKFLLFPVTVLLAVIAVSCNTDTSSVQDEIKYVRIYYDLVADDATVSGFQPYSEENEMYFTEIAEGVSEYELLVAYRAEYVLVGWAKEDGTEFTAGTPVYDNIVLTAKWVDKNDTPLV